MPPLARLTGVAAVGAALSGAAVSASCVSGPLVTGLTASDGSFDLQRTADQALPCMLKVTDGTPAVTFYGYAAQPGRVNVTPLTDLVLSRALASDPAAAFSIFDTAMASAIAPQLVAAEGYVVSQVNRLTGNQLVTGIMTGLFALGDADDRVLDQFGALIVQHARDHRLWKSESVGRLAA